MKKHLLKKFYELYESVKEVERSIVPEKYIQNGWVYFEEVHENLRGLYKEFDGSEYSELECLQDIMNKKGYYDTSKLSEEHRKKYERKMSKGGILFTENGIETNDSEDTGDTCIMMTGEFYKECKYCFIPLETLDEALDYMEVKGWIIN